MRCAGGSREPQASSLKLQAAGDVLISFLFKGLMRDRSRSQFPIIIVIVGVMLTVFMSAWMNGVMSDMTRSTASFVSGHVKIMSRAYDKESDQVPNDLAFQGVGGLLNELHHDYPDMVWTPRIRFGGLLDVPDSLGETRVQSPVAGLGADLLGSGTPEPGLLNLKTALVQGHLPTRSGEVLISDDLAHRLGLKPGDIATLFTSDVFSSMSSINFTIAGTVRFGIGAMDRGALLADVSDVQQVLDMPDAAGEVLGFFGDNNYDARRADRVVAAFNQRLRRRVTTRPGWSLCAIRGAWARSSITLARCWA